MDPEARRRACVEFRAKLSRDTGVTLTAAVCAGLLDKTYRGEGGEQVSLQSDPGLFYTGIGASIEAQKLVVLDHLKVAAWCYREASEVYQDPAGMRQLAKCLSRGKGVTEDPAQAAVWLEKAADMGVAASEAVFGVFLVHADAQYGVAKDAARGFKLLREAVERGHGLALYPVAQCYLKGEGVEKDAVHGVSILRQVITQGGSMTARAQTHLAQCYIEGNGVEVDTAQAALWCQRAAESDVDNAWAIALLPIIRTCSFCGTTPARQHCERCRKVRFCDFVCQAAHWNRLGGFRRAPRSGKISSVRGRRRLWRRWVHPSFPSR